MKLFTERHGKHNITYNYNSVLYFYRIIYRVIVILTRYLNDNFFFLSRFNSCDLFFSINSCYILFTLLEIIHDMWNLRLIFLKLLHKIFSTYLVLYVTLWYSYSYLGFTFLIFHNFKVIQLWNDIVWVIYTKIITLYNEIGYKL